MIPALALVATATLSAASPAAVLRLDEGPVELAFLDGGLGAPRSGRPRTELGLGLAGSILAAPDDFYGHLRARGLMWARWAIDDVLEVSLLIELVRLETVISSLQAGHLGFGSTSVGGTWRLAGGEGWHAALTTRAVLPTDYGSRAHALPFGLDLGVALSGHMAPALEVHATALALGSAQISDGPTLPRFGMTVSLGASWQAVSWLSVTADLGAMLGYDGPLDRLTAAAALRVRPTDEVSIELGATAPLLGEDRTQVVAGLGARLLVP